MLEGESKDLKAVSTHAQQTDIFSLFWQLGPRALVFMSGLCSSVRGTPVNSQFTRQTELDHPCSVRVVRKCQFIDICLPKSSPLNFVV